MSLLQKIKDNISKRNEEAAAECGDEDESRNCGEDEFIDIPSMLPSFTFYGHNWLVAPFMREIFKGRFDLIPVECVLTMYILRCYNICYYIVLDNNDTGNDFSIYEFEWIGADGERVLCTREHGSCEHGSCEHEHGEREHGEREHCEKKEKQEEKDPEFIEYAINMTALDAGKFLRERISEGYYIYIQERV